MDLVIAWGLLLLLVAAAAGAAWLGSKDVAQAAVLFRLVGGERNPTPGERVALHGPLEVHGYHEERAVGPVLYYKSVVQERVGSGRNSRWRTVAERSHAADMSVQQGAATVRVLDVPTEVHGTRRRVHRRGGGCVSFGGLLGERPTREIVRWLPPAERATCVGLLEERGSDLVLVPDDHAGLLLSPRGPRVTAWSEAGKAAFWLLLAPALLVAAWYALQHAMWLS